MRRKTDYLALFANSAKASAKEQKSHPHSADGL
jgi:hypothetical protein